ncbi:MAG: LapA family protein [Cycloclasticus sp.]|nr:LapA family protein [Cycloclasticus sp.]MBQ0789425.1 LapA family protein [Cycloclasticus sp.]
MKFFYLLLFVIFIVIGFVLSILNSAPIKINYYYGWIELPLSFAILISFSIGVLLGLSAKFWNNYVLRRQYNRLAKEAELTKKEVSNLRTYPAKQIN